MSIDRKKLDEFTTSFIDELLSNVLYLDDENNETRDTSKTIDDLSEEALETIIADCNKFQLDNADRLTRDNLYEMSRHTVESLGGYCFYHTRVRSGVGFWDGRWVYYESMCASAKSFGMIEAYIGDDGKIYLL